MPGYADQFLDPTFALAPPLLAEWTTAAESEAKLGILVDNLKAVHWAGQIPRRLGAAATGLDLARDKQRCKATAHMLLGLINGWATLCPGWDHNAIDPEAVSLDLRQRGAQLIWDAWTTVTREQALWDRTRLVTVALQAGERPWANVAAALLTRELTQLDRLAAKFA